MKSQHEGVRFLCDLCDYKANWKHNLLTHIKSIHENVDVKFPCELCDFKAKQKGTLLNHIQSIHGDVRFPCKQ